MHIALVIPLYRPAIGGVEIHVEKLATGLANNGHEVEVLTQDRHGSGLAAEEMLDGVLVRRFSTPLNSRHYAFAPRLAKFLDQHSRRYDLVHAHNYHALPALVAAQKASSAFVLTPHYHGVSESVFRSLLLRPYRLVGGRAMRRAEKIVSVSRSEAALISRHFPRAAGKVSVIPNGVDALAIDAAVPFDRSSKTIVLSAGRLESYKRVDLVVRAMEHLDDRYVLRVSGDGPARPELEAIVNRAGLADRVRLLGRIDRDDLNRWFRSADVYVSMSTIEAMGISSMEALYAGARVVASDIPAHRETAELGGPRFDLVPLDASPLQLAAAIAAASAREVPPLDSAIPTWPEVLKRTEAVYEEAGTTPDHPTPAWLA